MEKSRKKGSLRRKIILNMMMVIFISNLSLLIINQLFVKSNFKKQILEDIEVLGAEISGSMELQIGYNEKLVKELAANPVLTSQAFSDDARNNYYMSKAEEHGFKVFFYTDSTGIAKNLTPSKDQFDVANRDFFIEGMKGNLYTTSVVTDEMDQTKIFIISAPVYDRLGKQIGVFSGIKSLDFLSKLCVSFQWLNTGSVTLIDGKGNFVGYKESEYVKQGKSVSELYEIQGNEGLKEFFQDHILKEKKGVGSYKLDGVSKISGFQRIGIRDLVVILSIDEVEIFKSISDLTRTLVIISIIFFFIIFIVVAWISTATSGAFRYLQYDVEKLANYNLDYESQKDYSGRNDEIGGIYNALSTLKTNLTNIVKNISAHAQNTAATAQELSATAQSTTENATQVAAAVGNIAEGATHQAEDTENMNREVAATSEIIRNVIGELDELFMAVASIDQRKEEGQKSLSELDQVSKQSRERAGSINQVIIETNESAEQISKASEMIQSISDQTNLLALNAAIEAARAGDQGRGFAVVAEEIRKLAEQSAGFSGEIKKIIESLKNRTEFAVSEMDAVKNIIMVQMDKLEETGIKFGEIAAAVERSKVIVDAVNDSSKEMERRNEQMANSIVTLSGIAENNAATTEQAAASVETQVASIRDISDASEGLAALALQLQDEISEFKL